MADFRDFIDALEQMKSTAGAVSNSASNLSRNVEGGGAVMTDVGPGNARAYTSILAGGKGPGAAGPLPPDIANLSDDELRALVNQLAGKKAGRKGAAGKGMARDVLLQLAASAMGFAPPEPSQSSGGKGWSKILGGAPPPPGSSSGKGYSNTIGSPPPPGEPPVVAMGAPGPSDDEPRSLREAIKRLTEAIGEANRHQDRTVAQDVRGLSWAERRERLDGAGRLLSEEDVQGITQKTSVTPRDIIRESERREQRERDAKQAGLRTAIEEASAAVGRKAGPMAGRVASWVGGVATRGGASAAGAALGTRGMAGAIGRLGAGAVGAASGPVGWAAMITAAAGAAAIALLKLPGATERLAKSFLDTQRGVAEYSAAMQGLFMRMDYQQRVLSAQQAEATGGSTTLLGSEYMKLREETQWAREAWATGKNLLGSGFVELGRLVNLLVRLSPTIQAISRVLELIEGALQRPPSAEIFDYLGGIGREHQGGGRPWNQRPNNRGGDE